MERINDEGQWIVLMGFIISVSLFFLAIVINQSVTVGQTTSEAVLEFPKNEISSVRDVVTDIALIESKGGGTAFLEEDLSTISMDRMNAIVYYSITPDTDYEIVEIRFNNGVTEYNETYRYY